MTSQTSTARSFGGVEAGGTKFICAIGTGPEALAALTELPTRDPRTTLAEVIDFFRGRIAGGDRLAGVGVGSFGPLELNRAASNYGHITNTPKPGWNGVDVRGAIAHALGLPVAIDTDVNAAAIGELYWGAACNLDHVLYVTVGTGIGVGAVLGKRVVQGQHHPEMGHMYVPTSQFEVEDFTGICPFHGGCIEGLASGAAIVERWGSRLDELPRDHPAWDLEADYLATFLSNLTVALQPQRIIVGGGVVSDALLSNVRERLHARLAGYRASLTSVEALDRYVMRPGLGAKAGVLGAMALAGATGRHEQAVP